MSQCYPKSIGEYYLIELPLLQAENWNALHFFFFFFFFFFTFTNFNIEKSNKYIKIIYMALDFFLFFLMTQNIFWSKWNPWPIMMYRYPNYSSVVNNEWFKSIFLVLGGIFGRHFGCNGFLKILQNLLWSKWIIFDPSNRTSKLQLHISIIKMDSFTKKT